MKYLLISLFVIVGVGSTKHDHFKSDDIIINNETLTSVPVTEINVPTEITHSQDTTTNNSTVVPTITTPSNSTTATTTTTTTTTPTTTTPKVPTTISSTTAKPSNSTTTTTSTTKPSIPTTAPVPEHHRRFDGPSFVGGIVLALGLVAIGFVAFKFYKARTELNYHTL